MTEIIMRVVRPLGYRMPPGQWHDVHGYVNKNALKQIQEDFTGNLVRDYNINPGSKSLFLRGQVIVIITDGFITDIDYQEKVQLPTGVIDTKQKNLKIPVPEDVLRKVRVETQAWIPTWQGAVLLGKGLVYQHPDIPHQQPPNYNLPRPNIEVRSTTFSQEEIFSTFPPPAPIQLMQRPPQVRFISSKMMALTQACTLQEPMRVISLVLLAEDIWGKCCI